MSKIVLKDKKVKLAKGLSSLEFQCQCRYDHCLSTLVSSKLIKAFDKFRTLVNVPLRITSGYRCPRHNIDVGGVKTSRHMAGEAIDITLKSLSHLSNADIEFALRDSGFTFVKFYKTFFHADVR